MTGIKCRLLATASIAAIAVGAATSGQAADLLVGAAPIVPQEIAKGRTISGTASIFGSYSWLDPDDIGDNDSGQSGIEDNPWSIGGDALVDIPLSDYVSLQIDQYGEALFGSQTSDEDLTGGYLTGLHLNYREMDRYLVGAFGGVGRVHFASTDDDSDVQWLAGVEGQLYFGNTTLYAQGGYSDTESNNSTSAETINEAWFLRGVARHYLYGGDTKLEGEVGWITGKNDNDVNSTTDSIDAIWWGAEVEHAVASFGDDGFVSLFARYDGYYYHEDQNFGGSEEAFAHVVKLGIRMDMNNANPLARERNGVAVNLPNMTRINGHSRLTE